MGPPPTDLLLSSQPDERLVTLARAGSEQAFAAIVHRYRRELYAKAGRMRCGARADDLVQQTFLSAFAALRSGTEVKHLRGWLHRILRNEVIRTSSRPILEVELDPASFASESLEEASQRRMLALETLSSIAALPARQRHALVATALEGESRAAVAGSMGLSEGAVRQLMHRARATLRAAVAAITPSPIANWLAAIRHAASNQGPEIAIGGGATSAGVAVKLGAILVTGAVATGVVGSELASRSGHPAAGPVQSKNEAVAGALVATGRAGGAGGPAVVRLVALGIAGQAGGTPQPQSGGHGQTGVQSTGLASPNRNPIGRPIAGSVPPGSTHATSGGSPSAGGAAEPERGGSSGQGHSGGDGGGSRVDGGSEPASASGSNGGDSGATGSAAGAVASSGDGGHDGGSSDGRTLNVSGASDGAGGSSDGGSSGTSGSDQRDLGTAGSSSSGG